MELYLKSLKSLNNYYKYNINYFNCTFWEFLEHTHYKYLINMTYNYKIKTDSLHNLIHFKYT